MKKNYILLASAALVITSCAIVPPVSSSIESKSEEQSSISEGTSVSSQTSEETSAAPKGNFKIETIDGKICYRMDVNDAEGWHNGGAKMNGKPNADGTPTSDSMSTWAINGEIIPALYDVYMIGHMSSAGHASRHWNNHSTNGAVDDATSNPDTSEEDPFRYFVKMNGADSHPIYPNVSKSWGELGFDATTNKPGLMIEGLYIPYDTSTFHLLHGNIGYSMFVESIRLVPSDSGGEAQTDSTPAVSSSSSQNNQSEIINSSEQSAADVRDGGITLTKNHTGAEVSILHPDVQQYCDDMYAAYDAQDPSHTNLYKIQEVKKTVSGYMCPNVFASSYQGQAPNNDKDHFQPIQLEWTIPSGYSGNYTVKYSTKSDLSAWNAVVTPTNKAELINLLTDTVYYWKVETETGNHDSAIGSFKTKGSFRTIQAGPAYNVRDMGGKMTSSGRRTKQGLIYRGSELTDHWFRGTNPVQDHIVTCDATTVSVLHDKLKVRNEIDIRTAGAETDNQNYSYLGNDVTFSQLATGSGFDTMWRISGTNKSNLKEIFRMFGQATKDQAVYYHCWGGADRTGTSCFILNGLLGVSFLEACMDYEFTSFDTIHTRLRTEKVTDGANYSYDFTNLISAMKSSTYYTQSNTKTFQDVCYRWCKGQLGLTDAEITTIKENLLEPAI